MQIPFFDAVTKGNNILLAGAGGGFDIASGVPLYRYLRRLGKNVVLANLSFSELAFTNSEQVFPGAYLVNQHASDVQYFPEKFVFDWLAQQGDAPVMYGMPSELGVQPLRAAYRYIVQQHQIDTLVLVDGGTDSLMFGDEIGVATIVEDSCSIIAASGLTVEQSFLVAIGFGVEYFHKLDHYACLENMATLTKSGDYLGAFSLTADMPDGKDFLKLVEYMNQRCPYRPSIVAHSISNAMRGEFGNFHSLQRTRNTEQFISPLMSLYWCYKLNGIASRITFANEIEATETMDQVAKIVQLHRAKIKKRVYREIPL